MLDIEFIRENPDLVKRAAAAKGFAVDLDRLIALDMQRRELMKNTNNLRERLNRLSKKIPTLSAAASHCWISLLCASYIAASTVSVDFPCACSKAPTSSSFPISIE